MATVTIYQKPTCTTCRQVYNALVESGVDFNSVDYYLAPLTTAKLEDLLKKLGITARELLRTKGPEYTDLNRALGTITDDELIELMVQNPGLIQRPIVEKGDRAIIARPAERIRELF
jgi:arsenate reductase